MGRIDADSNAAAGVAVAATPKRRRWWRRLLWLPVWFVVFTVLQVLILRFVDPPFSTMMAERQIEALFGGEDDFALSYDWRDADRISKQLPLALVA
jgi:monofunctional biosynthetic peptidoglycan transglycosylase